ncbi:MAG: AzlD domain-containing protein [Paenalcaligenes sp.]
MSNIDLILIALLGCLGTLLIRYVPLRLHGRQRQGQGRRKLHQMLAAIGPAAIVSLLTVSLIAEVSPQSPILSVLPGAFGLVGVWLGRKLFNNSIAAGTIVGVLAYAACTAMLG